MHVSCNTNAGLQEGKNPQITSPKFLRLQRNPIIICGTKKYGALKP